MEFRKQQSIYLQIADHICEKILKKIWEKGDRIPSVRELAVEIEVNPNTVMRAYSYLQERGIVFNQRGIGYFISEDGYQKSRMMQQENFIKNELPRLLNTLELLDIKLEDLGNLH